MIIFSNALMLLGGLGVFLVGMRLISDNLKQLSGERLKKMFLKISSRPIAGISIGAGAGAILESSSATTVILLGMVDSGIINLVQATLIIMGANIGTTFSVLLFSLSSLPISEILCFLTLVGIAIIMASKKEITNKMGYLIAGFGMIFVGLYLMKDSMSFLKTSEGFSSFILSIKNPILLCFVGLVFSALVQSSSAVSGILITLSEAGLMPITSAFAIILGSNVGSCATAIIASLGSSTNAKCTSVINLLFNAIGAILFLPLTIIFGNKLEDLLIGRFNPSVIIAYFHLIFNLITTLLLCPFAKHIAKMSESIVQGK